METDLDDRMQYMSDSAKSCSLSIHYYSQVIYSKLNELVPVSGVAEPVYKRHMILAIMLDLHGFSVEPPYLGGAFAGEGKPSSSLGSRAKKTPYFDWSGDSGMVWRHAALRVMRELASSVSACTDYAFDYSWPNQWFIQVINSAEGPILILKDANASSIADMIVAPDHMLGGFMALRRQLEALARRGFLTVSELLAPTDHPFFPNFELDQDWSGTPEPLIQTDEQRQKAWDEMLNAAIDLRAV